MHSCRACFVAMVWFGGGEGLRDNMSMLACFIRNIPLSLIWEDRLSRLWVICLIKCKITRNVLFISKGYSNKLSQFSFVCGRFLPAGH